LATLQRDSMKINRFMAAISDQIFMGDWKKTAEELRSHGEEFASFKRYNDHVVLLENKRTKRRFVKVPFNTVSNSDSDKINQIYFGGCYILLLFSPLSVVTILFVGCRVECPVMVFIYLLSCCIFLAVSYRKWPVHFRMTVVPNICEHRGHQILTFQIYPTLSTQTAFFFKLGLSDV